MRNAVCARTTLVTLDGEVRPAGELAAERGLNWTTVKMRRYRGWTWTEALSPELRPRSRWMGRWCYGAKCRLQTIAC